MYKLIIFKQYQNTHKSVLYVIQSNKNSHENLQVKYKGIYTKYINFLTPKTKRYIIQYNKE